MKWIKGNDYRGRLIYVDPDEQADFEAKKKAAEAKGEEFDRWNHDEGEIGEVYVSAEQHKSGKDVEIVYIAWLCNTRLGYYHSIKEAVKAVEVYSVRFRKACDELKAFQLEGDK